MELRQISYFVAVAEELHFGRAARRVHIAQPPLSQQIRKLEEELGARLFKRTSRSVSLTREGEAFLKEARLILAGVDRAAETVARTARGECGVLRIGFISQAMEGILPERIRAFRQAWPGVKLELEQLGTARQLERLDRGLLDLGFMWVLDFDVSGFDSRPFMREPYVLAAPSGDPIASKPKARLQDLSGRPMIFFPRPAHPGLYDEIIACFARARSRPRIVQEVAGKATTLALVAAGVGSALVSASSRGYRRHGVEYLDLEGDLPQVEVSAIWRKGDDSPALRRFLDIPAGD